MINGRNGENNFTNINTNGNSVVDYIFVPHEQLHKYTNFRVYPMSCVINDFNLQGHYRSTEHSILHVTLQHENLADRISLSDTPASKTQYKLSGIPASFMNCEISFRNLMDAIQKIEMSLREEQDVQQAYTDFVDLLRAEMDSKLQKRKHLKPNITNKPHKSKAKPYWNSELQELWNETCRCEKI